MFIVAEAPHSRFCVDFIQKGRELSSQWADGCHFLWMGSCLVDGNSSKVTPATFGPRIPIFFSGPVIFIHSSFNTFHNFDFGMFLFLIYLVYVLAFFPVLSYTHLYIFLVICHSLIHFRTYDYTIWSRDSIFRAMTKRRLGSERNCVPTVVRGVFIFIRRPSTLCRLDSDTIAKLKTMIT